MNGLPLPLDLYKLISMSGVTTLVPVAKFLSVFPLTEYSMLTNNAVKFKPRPRGGRAFIPSHYVR
jgi:hypothetical protein